MMKSKQSGFFILLFCFVFFSILSGFQSQAQTEKYIIQMVKHSSSEPRIVTIDNDSRFKAMLNDGQKIKGKVKNFYPGFLVSEKGDTINYNEIGWIKLQRELTRFQEIAALSGLLLCGYLSLAAIPAAMYLVAVEANYAIILLPVATVTSSVVGLKLLTGRRYQLGKWTIQSIELQ